MALSVLLFQLTYLHHTTLHPANGTCTILAARFLASSPRLCMPLRALAAGRMEVSQGLGGGALGPMFPAGASVGSRSLLLSDVAVQQHADEGRGTLLFLQELGVLVRQ